MYCRQCGKEIREGARFCGACGTAVPKAQEGAQPPAGDVASSSFQAEGAAFGQAEEEAVSLKGAVGKTQNRSKRRVPLIVLVALALALTSAIALAAYYVYTTYFAPQQQEQQTVSEIEQDDGTDAQALWDETVVKLQPVLDEYLQYLQVLEGAGDSSSINASDYEFVPVDSYNFGYAYGSFGDYDVLEYTFADLNNDGVPELIVGSQYDYYDEEGLTVEGSSCIPYGIYAIVDDEIEIVIMDEAYRGSYSLVEGGGIALQASSGFDIAEADVYRWTGANLECVESYFYDYVDSNDRGEDDSLYKLERTTDGVESSEIVTYTEILELVEDFSARYPELDANTLDWQELG